jgi:sulfonate transport system permease protein
MASATSLREDLLQAPPAAASPSVAGGAPSGILGARRLAGRGGSWLKSLGLGLLLPLLVAVLWEYAASEQWLRPNQLPAPSAVFDEMYGLAQTGELWQHLAATGKRVLWGFLSGALAATVLGALTGYSKLARQILDPTFQALKSVPSLAWVPLFILWFGIFELSKITLIAVGVFFPIYLNLMTGILATDRKLVEVGQVYGLSRKQLIWRVLLPATLPNYFTGLRAGLALGWMFVIAAELMGASKGLGFLMLDGQMTGRPQVIIGSLVLFAIVGKLTDSLLAWGARRALTWQDSFSAMGR